MSYRHHLQIARFELKYVISEHRARTIQAYLQRYLELDEHAPRDGDHMYAVQSLYVDTRDRVLAGQTIGGLKNRFKLRIRFYDDRPDSPVYLEIKRRVTDVICKERAAVSKEAARRLLNGERLSERDLIANGDARRPRSALYNFCTLQENIGAGGAIYVCYRRLAYVSPNSDQLRVTFDADLFGSPYYRGKGLELQSRGARPEIGGVILEIKFTDRFPRWMQDMTQIFDLQRRSVPKYVECLEEMDPRRHSGERVSAGIVR